MYKAIYVEAESFHLHNNLEFVKEHKGELGVINSILRLEEYKILNHIPILTHRINILNYKYHTNFKNILLEITNYVLKAYKNIQKELKSYDVYKLRENHYITEERSIYNDCEEKIDFKLRRLDEIIPIVENIINTLEKDIINIQNMS
jgi:hypothetical protein